MIPTGGRADVMVRCQEEGTFRLMQYDFGKMYPLFSLKVEGPKVESTDLEKWTPEYPDYLMDL